MTIEDNYSRSVSIEKRKSFGQFFTPPDIARFMSRWVCKGSPNSILDPALGLGIFFREMDKTDCDLEMIGFDIDNEIITWFKKHVKTRNNSFVYNADYLLDNWDKKYQGIVCNPPYYKFQEFRNRVEVIKQFKKETGVRFSGYTNIYALFLIKAMYQLKEGCHAAFIIPSEFMNTGYGVIIKKELLKMGMLRAIISFDSCLSVFQNVTTTSCVLLLSNNKNNRVEFIKLSAVSDLDKLDIYNDEQLYPHSNPMSYTDINPNEKWKNYFGKRSKIPGLNHVPLSSFGKVIRGIATGDNKYFVFNKEKMNKYKMPVECLIPCITKSNHIKNLFFSDRDFKDMVEKDMDVYLFNSMHSCDKSVVNYIQLGETMGVDKKYLTSHRKPWHILEKREPAPIWIGVFNRGKVKFIRNETSLLNLTCFHGFYPYNEYKEIVDIIFCYFLTDCALKLLHMNKREYGDGLDKFEPNDLNDALVLNFEVLTDEQINEINRLYRMLKDNQGDSGVIDKLNEIFYEAVNK